MSVQKFSPRVAVVPIAAQPSALPPWVWATDFLKEQISTPDELVKGILHRGSKMVLGGASKSCKTWTLLDLGISVSAGTDWLGFPTIKSKVLYLNLEIQREFMQVRIDKVMRAKGLDEPTGLAVWNLRGKADDICKMSPEIVDAAKDEGFALIIIDPIYKVMGDRVENSAEGIASLVNELERIAVQSGAAIVFGAHFSKGNQASKDAMDRIGGSGVYARDPDAILTFTAHQEEGAFSVDATLRNFAPVAPFVVRWEYPLMMRADDMDASKLKKAKTGRESVYSVKELVDVMGEKEWTTGDLMKAAINEVGMCRATFHTIKGKAVREKAISQSKINKLWSVVQ